MTSGVSLESIQACANLPGGPEFAMLARSLADLALRGAVGQARRNGEDHLLARGQTGEHFHLVLALCRRA